jgi:hypothetical protein
MEISQIFASMLDKPDAPKFYRELQSYYQKKNLNDEALAIGFLLENKFGKNNEQSSDGEHVSEEQSRNNSEFS